MSILHIRLVLALVGIATWAYGARIDSQNVRWLGIGIIGLSLLLRFVRPKQPPRDPGSPP